MESLNLAGADTSGFDALEAGAYNAEIVRAEWKETKGGENAKMPAGCPLLNIGFKVLDEPYEGQWVWASFPIGNKEYEKANKDKQAKLKGMLVRFIMAVTGDDEETVTSGDYNMDVDQLLDKECVVRVKKREYPKGSGEFTNDVIGVKEAGAPTTSAATAGGLL